MRSMSNTFKRLYLAGALSLACATVTLGQASPDLSALKENQPVQVREGDSWSKATFVKKEGRRYQIKYEDGTEEWVTADRLKLDSPADPKAPAAGGAPATQPGTPATKEPEKPKYPVFQVGQTVEMKDGPHWKQVKIVNKRGDWYYVEHLDGFKGWREWAENWRVRKPGSDYDFEGWAHGNKSFKPIADPPTPTPGDPPGTKKAGGSKPDDAPKPPAPPPVTITEAKRDGKELLPMASGPWVPPQLAMDPKFRIPTNVTPTILPSLEGFGARWSSLRITGTRGILIGERAGGGSDKTTGLVRIDIINNGVTKVEMPGHSEPLDLSPNGSLILARGNGQNGRVDIYKITTAAPQHVISFIPASEKAEVQDAFFADETTVITLSDKEIAAWDYAKAENLWKMSATGFRIGRGASNKAIAVHTKEGVAIVELPSGKVLNMLECETPGSLAFSGDGKRLMMLSATALTVWDMDTGARMYSMGLPQGLAGNLVAINKDFAMIGQYLFSLEKKSPIWRYEAASLQAWGGGRVFNVYNDGKRNVLTSAELPHARAKEAAAKAPEAVMVIKPGMSISVDIQPEADDATKKQISEALARQLTNAGMKVEDNQPLRLVARTEVGQSEQRQYERRGFGRFPGQGEVETVTITRKATRLMLQYEGQVIWKTEQWSGNDPGSWVQLQEGQKVQDVINSRGGGLSVDWLATTKVPTLLAAPMDLKFLPSSTWALGGVKDQ